MYCTYLCKRHIPRSSLFKLQDAGVILAFFAGRYSSGASASNEPMGAFSCSADRCAKCAGNAVDVEALGAMAVATSTHGDEGTANGLGGDFYGFLVCVTFSKRCAKKRNI